MHAKVLNKDLVLVLGLHVGNCSQPLQDQNVAQYLED